MTAFAAKVITLHPTGLAGLPDDPMRNVIDGTLWTIRYEFDCYLLVAALGLLLILNRAPAVILFGGFALLYFMQAKGYVHIPRLDHGWVAILISSPDQWPRLFTYFFAGSAFYLWRDHIPKSPAIAALCAVVILLGLRFGAAEPILIVAGTYLLWFAMSFAVVPRIAGRRTDLSYGIYLYGFPIQQIVVAWSLPEISPLVLFAYSLPITCAVAYFSWTFIEEPCLSSRVGRGPALAVPQLVPA